MEAHSVLAPKIVNPRRPPQPRYALAQYTIEQRGTRWYYIRTAAHSAAANGQWTGPYKSLHAVTFAVAAALKVEAKKRHRTRCELYGLDD